MAKFRTRARTVDMLGRQQIAGIPTAISELFKNAHDAYANEVTASFLEYEFLFALRDDGHGMTPEEFEGGWLTLGTESKLVAREAPPRGDRQRPLLGEKGIGRLAISVIGPQVLILTRSASAGVGAPLLMSFLHWGMFEIPGVDLEELEIPIALWEAPGLPARSDVDALINDLRANLERIPRVVGDSAWARIVRDLDGFEVDPTEADASLPGPTLADGHHGTHFYIKPTDESLTALLATSESETTSRLQKMLVGFANTMTPNHPPPPLQTHFFHYRAPDDVEDVIDEREFFTPEDFGSADHLITGQFDEFGQFVGEISVYGESPIEHLVAWRPARGTPTFCGPFRITVAYVQGALRQSRLPPEELARMNQKLERAAGLYVYRDGIRVLPYGDSRYDFLDIEERRTRSAKYYFFSYRRMFGAIDLDSVRNKSLQEKAGREGFRENAAYRQFRAILENFFIETAAEYFREGGDQADPFLQRRAQLTREEEARQRRERTVTARRAAFRASLEETLGKIDAGAPAVEVTEVQEEFKRAAAVAAREQDPTRRIEAFLDAEDRARAALREVRDEYVVARPRGVGLSRALRREWETYRDAHKALQEELFPKAESDLERVIVDSVSPSDVGLDVRRRLERSIESTASAARADVRKTARDVRDAAARLHDIARAAASDAIRKTDDVITRGHSRVASIGTASSPEDIASLRVALEAEIEDVTRRNVEMLARLMERVEASVALVTGREEDDVDLEGLLDEELIALRDRADIDLELSAIGMAVEVINHEFEANRRAVRSYLRRLGAWAERNPALKIVFDGLTGSFDQLDSYLTLFTPLQRRIYRKAIDIRGSDIDAFLRDLFRRRLLDDQVTLDVTQAFRDEVIHGYPSTFYPVFVNLVDNAMHWLTQRDPPRIVRLDADMGDLVVSDNGPGIRDRDRDEIFELGFTRKPAGRGLGLHISRDLLAKVDWEIAVEETPGGGATFRLHRKDDQVEDE